MDTVFQRYDELLEGLDTRLRGYDDCVGIEVEIRELVR
jgi:hypothetical protein